jgi:hypothetical protein
MPRPAPLPHLLYEQVELSGQALQLLQAHGSSQSLVHRTPCFCRQQHGAHRPCCRVSVRAIGLSELLPCCMHRVPGRLNGWRISGGCRG